MKNVNIATCIYHKLNLPHAEKKNNNNNNKNPILATYTIIDNMLCIIQLS